MHRVRSSEFPEQVTRDALQDHRLGALVADSRRDGARRLRWGHQQVDERWRPAGIRSNQQRLEQSRRNRSRQVSVSR